MTSATSELSGPRKPIIPQPQWQEFKDGSGGKYSQIHVSDEPDGEILEYIAAALMRELGGRYTAKLSGLDEAYWDLMVGNDTIVVHLQHYLGIMIYPAGLSEATDGEIQLLEKAFKVIEKNAAV